MFVATIGRRILMSSGRVLRFDIDVFDKIEVDSKCRWQMATTAMRLTSALLLVISACYHASQHGRHVQEASVNTVNR